MKSKIRIIVKSDIPELLSMRRCMEVIDACMREVSLRNVELPLRWGLKAGSKGVMGMIPGYLGNHFRGCSPATGLFLLEPDQAPLEPVLQLVQR